jgi:5'-nucleotidase
LGGGSNLHVLITNDDGYTAPGLLALKQAVEKVADKVSVVAPDRNWSISGHSKTMDRPLRASEMRLQDGSPVIVTDGSPSDCVALAILGLVPGPIDVVVSGINPSANLAQDITYSGTVSAAFEGVLSGIPSLAVSVAATGNPIYQVAADFAAHLVRLVHQHGLPPGTLLNINVPNVPKHAVAGVAVTRLGRRIYRDRLIERKDPFGRSYYWIGGDAPTGHLEEGTDIAAIERNLISVTPVQLDLTNYGFLEQLKNWNLSWPG